MSDTKKPIPTRHRRRFSNYLLDKSLQLRYIAFVTVLSAALSATLGYMIWQQEAQATSEVLDSVAEFYCGNVPLDQCEDLKIIQSTQGDLESRDKERVLTMVYIGLALVVALVLYLLIMTHKVAGPLYKVSTYFSRMAEGKLGKTYPLRKGDMLQDFYDKFQEMHDQVRTRHQEDNERALSLLQACKDAGVEREGRLGEALDRLQEHCDARNDALN
jgi:hypothetical protein